MFGQYKQGNPVMKAGLVLLFLFVCFHAVSNIWLEPFFYADTILMSPYTQSLLRPAAR